MYLPASQADSVGVQNGLVDIQLDSDQLRKGRLLLLHLFSSLQKVVAFLFIEFLLLFFRSPVAFIGIQNGLVALSLNSWD